MQSAGIVRLDFRIERDVAERYRQFHRGNFLAADEFRPGEKRADVAERINVEPFQQFGELGTERGQRVDEDGQDIGERGHGDMPLDAAGLEIDAPGVVGCRFAGCVRRAGRAVLPVAYVKLVVDQKVEAHGGKIDVGGKSEIEAVRRHAHRRGQVQRFAV